MITLRYRHLAAAVSLQGLSEIDLIDELNLHNTTYEGLTFVKGTHNSSPTIHLSGSSRHVQLPQHVLERASYLLSHSDDFTFLATINQDPKNTGAIVSFSEGNNKFLEIQSSGRRDEIRFMYRHNNAPNTVSFPYHLADGNWHQLAVSISGDRIDVFVDCNRIYRRMMYNINLRSFDKKLVSLWLGQRNDIHFLFKGYLRDVKLIGKAYGYNVQCPHLEADCPTCGQFKSLQSSVLQLENYVKQLSAKLIDAERRLAQVEECECFKSCRVNGTFHPDGATWQQDCDICSCLKGKVICRHVPCLPPPCKNYEVMPGECCPVCKKKCRHNGRTLEHKEKFTKDCITCECIDGSTKCKQIDPKTVCPPLNCSMAEQFRKEGECCKYCRGTDFCALGHDCHEKATCHNLITEYSCYCNPGYWGNGKICMDVNECLQQGGHKGHHCQDNTRCVNTEGSYKCECLKGYTRKDALNCIDIDECQSNEQKCHENAECLNTPGSYKCRCLPGYVGDGLNCEPVCNETCRNGGKCIAPNTCSCRRGYEGRFCESDINECLLESSLCLENSVCVNMPGWYYCQCKPGYHSVANENTHEAYNSIDCKDVDECSEDVNTCDESTDCINFEGGYKCECKSEKNCSYNCIDNSVIRVDGETWPDDSNLCSQCSCHKGVISCHPQTCNCDDAKVDLNCCPQCDSKSQCHHQDDYSIVFKSGETWVYHCQMCECLFGEIDCWDYECPPILCSNPTKEDGDCCPRCEDDPCDMPSNYLESNKSHSSQNISNIGCMYMGRSYQTGERVPIERDPCASCKCKNGRLCCTYSSACISNARNPSLLLNHVKRSVEDSVVATEVNEPTAFNLDDGGLSINSTNNGKVFAAAREEYKRDRRSNGWSETIERRRQQGLL